LQHFGKIGTGDIVLLAEEMEKEKKERETVPSRDDPPQSASAVAASTGAGDDSGESGEKRGIAEDVKMEVTSNNNVQDGEGDVKME
jgi:THO complex subunit 1